jgi:Zn-dependent protease with chaperone function
LLVLATVGAGLPCRAAEPLTLPTTEARRSTDEPRVPSVIVTEEMRAHQRWVDLLYFGGTIYGFLILVAVLGLGISARLRELARRAAHREFVVGMVTYALLAVVLTILSLPVDLLAGYVVPHRFELTDQSLLDWSADQIKGLLVGIVIGSPLAAFALLGIRRVRRWWLALWIGTIPVVLAMILVGPVLLDPIFNDFKPLQDEQLQADLVQLAEKAGISRGRVFEVNKSKQTKTMNAYVNGLGPTKRIVLWDTILAKMPHDELMFVMAHEMGHYVMHHVWIMVGFILVVLFGVFCVSQRTVEWATARWGTAWGFDRPHDPAAVPLLLLVVSVALFLLTPALNAFSRKAEHDADIFALELTRDGDAGARAFVRLAEDSKVLPDPHPFVRFWRYGHPTLAERIEFCRSYRPWEEGRPNRRWRPDPPLSD